MYTATYGFIAGTLIDPNVATDTFTFDGEVHCIEEPLKMPALEFHKCADSL